MQNNAYKYTLRINMQHERQTMDWMFLCITLMYWFKTQILGKHVMRSVEKCLYLHLQLLNNNFISRAWQKMPLKYTVLAQHGRQAAGEVFLVICLLLVFLF